ncbi:hypothetical protein H6F71_01645 [Microcoleus sp. FACHB-61]|nr:hypothetical protein [Microcoleus sp. FACHB-61]
MRLSPKGYLHPVSLAVKATLIIETDRSFYVNAPKRSIDRQLSLVGCKV